MNTTKYVGAIIKLSDSSWQMKARPVNLLLYINEHLVRGDVEDVDAEIAGNPRSQDDDAAQVVVGDAPVLPHSAGLRIRAEEAEHELGMSDRPDR